MIKIPTTKLITILCISLLITTLTAGLIQQRVAAQSTSQSSESAEVDDADKTVTENIKQLILETASQVKGVANSDKKAMIGEVQRVTDEALTIQHLDGQQIIPLASALLLEDSEAINIEDIAVGNWVTILGSQQDKTITPDYILVSEDSYKTDPQIVAVGTITEIGRNTITIQPRNEEGEKEISITTTTDFEDPEGNPVVIGDFEVDMTVLITGFETGDEEDTEIEASTIRSLAPLDTSIEE